MATPGDLAAVVQNELERLECNGPGIGILTELLETAFFASLARDEAARITPELVYIDPDNPDPDPPPYIRRPRWRFFRLDSPIPLNVPSLVKIARATDGRTSSLGVFANRNGQLEVVGLVDEGLGHGRQRALESGFVPPGVFRVAVLDVGRVAVHVDLEQIGELNGRELTRPGLRVFDEEGPILTALMGGFRQRLETHAATSALSLDETEVTFAFEDWVTDIRRLLLRIQGYKHGGAVLLVPDAPDQQALHIKYGLDYDRFGDALAERSALLSAKYGAETAIDDSSSAEFWRDVYMMDYDVRDSEEEVDGVLWFLSLLSRVDGLIATKFDLQVLGFGCEILVADSPEGVWIAEDVAGDARHPGEYERWGTRHRSMMRFCASYQGALGFVISQDGDARAMMSIDGDLVVWDGLALHRHIPTRAGPKFARNAEPGSPPDQSEVPD